MDKNYLKNLARKHTSLESFLDYTINAYHGTSAPAFDKFKEGVLYVALDPREAIAFALDPILGGGRLKGTPRIIKLYLPEGKSKNINDMVQEVIMEENPNYDSLDEYIEAESKFSKHEGCDYLSFYHPSTVPGKDEFEAIIVLNPSTVFTEKDLISIWDASHGLKINENKVDAFLNGDINEDDLTLQDAEIISNSVNGKANVMNPTWNNLTAFLYKLGYKGPDLMGLTIGHAKNIVDNYKNKRKQLSEIAVQNSSIPVNMNVQELEAYIDMRYEAGASQLELDSLEDLYDSKVDVEMDWNESDGSIGEGIFGQGADLDEQLVYLYYIYVTPEARTAGRNEEDIIYGLRSVLFDLYKKYPDDMSDSEILDIAKDFYERKKNIIARYKQTSKLFPPSEMFKKLDKRR